MFRFLARDCVFLQSMQHTFTDPTTGFNNLNPFYSYIPTNEKGRMTTDHYERTRPYHEMIHLYQSSRAMTSNNGIDELGAIYKEMGYIYKPTCAGCKATMMDDFFNFITKYEHESN